MKVFMRKTVDIVYRMFHTVLIRAGIVASGMNVTDNANISKTIDKQRRPLVENTRFVVTMCGPFVGVITR